MPLIQESCSVDLLPFLCSIYLPECPKPNQTIIRPCRSMCESAKEGCFSVLKRFGFDWPSHLNCGQFNNEQPCIKGSSLNTSDNNQDAIADNTSVINATCEPISVPLCKGLDYNYTIMPNSMGHRTQDHAGLEVR